MKQVFEVLCLINRLHELEIMNVVINLADLPTTQKEHLQIDNPNKFLYIKPSSSKNFYLRQQRKSRSYYQVRSMRRILNYYIQYQG